MIVPVQCHNYKCHFSNPEDSTLIGRISYSEYAVYPEQNTQTLKYTRGQAKMRRSNYLVYGTRIPIERWCSLAYDAEAFTQGLLRLVNLHESLRASSSSCSAFRVTGGEA